MPTLQVRAWAENSGVGVSQWSAETIGIWEERGRLTTQRNDNQVRGHVWEVAQSMRISNKLGAGLEQWDLLIDHCITPIKDLASKRPLWKWYMADKTNLDGQKLKAALDESAGVGLHRRKNWLDEILTRKEKLVHDVLCILAPVLLCLFLMMCTYIRRCERNLGSQVLADIAASRRLDRLPCQAI